MREGNTFNGSRFFKLFNILKNKENKENRENMFDIFMVFYVEKHITQKYAIFRDNEQFFESTKMVFQNGFKNEQPNTSLTF